jgi:hypothetical protein
MMQGCHLCVQGGGNPFANMGNIMENVKKAQQLVQVEAGKVRPLPDLASCMLHPLVLLPSPLNLHAMQSHADGAR